MDSVSSPNRIQSLEAPGFSLSRGLFFCPGFGAWRLLRRPDALRLGVCARSHVLDVALLRLRGARSPSPPPSSPDGFSRRPGRERAGQDGSMRAPSIGAPDWHSLRALSSRENRLGASRALCWRWPAEHRNRSVDPTHLPPALLRSLQDTNLRRLAPSRILAVAGATTAVRSVAMHPISTPWRLLATPGATDEAGWEVHEDSEHRRTPLCPEQSKNRFRASRAGGRAGAPKRRNRSVGPPRPRPRLLRNRQNPNLPRVAPSRVLDVALLRLRGARSPSPPPSSPDGFSRRPGRERAGQDGSMRIPSIGAPALPPAQQL
jgi:hypothetical protein